MNAAVWSATVGTALLATVVQVVFAGLAGRANPLGDEIEYLERAAAADPTAPGLFLRVPGFIWFVWGCRGRARRVRLAQHVVAVATVAVATAAAGLLGGAAVAWTSGIVLAVLPDRWVLAGRIWPDVVLAVHHAVLLMLLALASTGHAVSPWWFGIVAAVAMTVRIDAFALSVVFACLPLARGSATLSGAFGVLAPTMLVALALAVRNRRRYGVFAVDTTLAFNLRVMQREQQDHRTTVQIAVDESLGPWREAPTRGALRRALAALGAPTTVLVGVARRAIEMIGADTFARDRLLHPQGGWPHLSEGRRRAVRSALRVSTPLLLGLAACGLAVRPAVSLQFVVPAVAAYVVMCAVHARTRFRAVLFPWLALWTGLGLTELWRGPSIMPVLVGFAVAAVAAAAPPRRESA